jgi:hypothetical protein
MRDNTYFINMHTFSLEILWLDRLAGVLVVRKMNCEAVGMCLKRRISSLTEGIWRSYRRITLGTYHGASANTYKWIMNFQSLMHNLCNLVNTWRLKSKSKSKSKLLYDWRSVSQSVCLGIEPTLGLVTWYYFLSEGCCIVPVRRPLWREDGSAICCVEG